MTQNNTGITGEETQIISFIPSMNINICNLIFTILFLVPKAKPFLLQKRVRRQREEKKKLQYIRYILLMCT